MRKKTDIEMERHRVEKIARAAIRLKHSLEADVEINDVLPETLAEFDAALQSGELKRLYAGLAQLLGE